MLFEKLPCGRYAISSSMGNDRKLFHLWNSTFDILVVDSCVRNMCFIPLAATPRPVPPSCGAPCLYQSANDCSQQGKPFGTHSAAPVWITLIGIPLAPIVQRYFHSDCLFTFNAKNMQTCPLRVVLATVLPERGNYFVIYSGIHPGRISSSGKVRACR